MNEHGFIKSVHRYLPSDVFVWKIHDTFAGGVPDAFYAGPAGILFVEYKYVKKLPSKDTTAIRTSLSVQQALWLDRMVNSKQHAALVIGCEQLAVALVNGQWNVPLLKDDYVKRAVSRKEIAGWITEVVCGN